MINLKSFFATHLLESVSLGLPFRSCFVSRGSKVTLVFLLIALDTRYSSLLGKIVGTLKSVFLVPRKSRLLFSYLSLNTSLIFGAGERVLIWLLNPLLVLIVASLCVL